MSASGFLRGLPQAAITNGAGLLALKNYCGMVSDAGPEYVGAEEEVEEGLSVVDAE